VEGVWVVMTVVLTIDVDVDVDVDGRMTVVVIYCRRVESQHRQKRV